MCTKFKKIYIKNTPCNVYSIKKILKKYSMCVKLKKYIKKIFNA